MLSTKPANLTPNSVKHIYLVLIVSIIPACGTSQKEVVAGEEEYGDYYFAYRMHNGLDCGMTADCGFLLELGHSDTLGYWRSTGVDSLISENEVDRAFRDSLTSLLDTGGFFRLPREIPDPASRRGMRTVTYTFRANPDSIAVEKTAYLDETMFQFPDGFHIFDSSVRNLLLGRAGLSTDVVIDTTRRITHD